MILRAAAELLSQATIRPKFTLDKYFSHDTMSLIAVFKKKLFSWSTEDEY